jgi:hypothetical protein
MPVSLAGLDLSFMRDNPLPPAQPREARPDFSVHRAAGVSTPYFMPDIKPFVQVSTREPSVISSRSDLARFERTTGLRQAGDIKPGEIAAEHNRQKADLIKKSKGVEHGWTDFNP